MSQAELADRSGLDEDTILVAEHGDASLNHSAKVEIEKARRWS